MPLISTIATGLTLAFGLGLIASKLRIPPIVGYLLAGILIGPYTPGYVGDMKIAEQLSELGIVLLMFGVGLHFSMKDLMAVRKIALPGAVGQIGAAVGLGTLLAHYMWGWSLESGLMFGLALSVASTVVLLRALEDNGLLQSTNGRIAVGWLIVEDIAMILALVLIPALADTGMQTPPPPADMIATTMENMKSVPSVTSPLALVFLAVGKVVAFVAVMLVAGRKLLPWLLNAVTKTRSRELFTLAVFAAAMGVAYGAAKVFGVSFALGAFFAGMMIKESDLNHEVADRSLPFQDAFAVLFFVSVGMLFNPYILIENPVKVLAVVGIIIVGKSIAATLIVLMFSYPLKTALIVSAGLAQIGEFSFILINLGYSHGLLPEEGMNLVLAGALISIALNPLVFHAFRWLYEYAGRVPKLSSHFNIDESDLSHLRRGEKQALKDLVILIGYGQVGKQISKSIQEAHIDLVIIDSNRDRIDALRTADFHAIAGDGGNEETLRAAAIEKAIAIAVAIPDPFEARRIVEVARQMNPEITILARAHNEEEYDYFLSQGVNLVLTGPREIGRSMAEYLNNMRNMPPPPKSKKSRKKKH